MHFTKFRADGTLNLRDYLDTVFIQIVDIWGFICVYYPFIETLGNNYKSLGPTEMKIFNKLKIIFIKYLYNPRHEPINLNTLYTDLRVLGGLLYQAFQGKKKTTTPSSSSKSSTRGRDRASGLRKTRKNIRKSAVKFTKKPNQKRFKNPIFLSLK